jgi:hypothetical protein
MLRYAYERKVPLQMLLSYGYDQALNENKFTSAFGTTAVIYRFYESIDANAFSSSEAYCEEVSRLYEERFHEVTRATLAIQQASN